MSTIEPILDPLPADPATPALPAEPSPITDAQLPALVEQLRGVFADIAKKATEEAIAATPVPRVIAGTVQQVDVANLSVTVLTDDAIEGAVVSAAVINERPNPNERVNVLSIPGGAAFVIGAVGGGGVPPGGVIGYVGQIDAAVASSTSTAAPRGWAMAYGQVLKQNAVPWFFNQVGTRHNTGGEAADEVRLPDMRGRFLMGLDNMGGSDAGRISSISNAVGATGGAETHTLAEANLPSHSHSFTPSGSVTISSITGSVSVSDSGHSHGSPDGSSFVTASGDLVIPASGIYNANNSAGSSTATGYANVSGSLSGMSGSGSFSGNSGTTGTTGSGSAVTHLPPTMAVFWLVKL